MTQIDRVCITGADGYFGLGLAKLFISATDFRLLLMVRADSAQEQQAKKEKLLKHFSSDQQNRIDLYFANLGKEQSFTDIDRYSICSIIHTAAITRFNVEADLADAVNRDGTERILQFAASCPNLTHYMQVGTVYSSGLRDGLIGETALDNSLGFANHYERSKWEAEQLLLEKYHFLPWQLPRVATIVADNAEGRITQYNVVHNTLRLLYMGLTSIMPGEKTTPLYFVTGDFVIHSLFYLATQSGVRQKIFHICQPDASTVTIGGLIDLVFEVFSDDESFRKRRILKPLLSDYGSFESLANTLDGMAGLIVRQALESMRPFAKQMFSHKKFDNTNLRQHWPGYYELDQVLLLKQVVKNLVASRWGSQPMERLTETQL